MENYIFRNQKIIDEWVDEEEVWGPILDKEEFSLAKRGQFPLLLTPTRPIPKSWLGNLIGKKVLGLGAGGGTQMGILSAQGAICSLIDISPKQIEKDLLLSQREGYPIELILGNIENSFPFPDAQFDLVILPSTLVYVSDISRIFLEIFRVLKPGGHLLGGFTNEVNFFTDLDQERIQWPMPFNPLIIPQQASFMIENHAPYQFSHSLEEQIGGMLKQGFLIEELFEDTNGEGKLHELNIQTFYAIKARKPGRKTYEHSKGL